MIDFYKVILKLQFLLDHSMLVQFRNRISVPFFQSRILVSELKTSSGVRHFNRRNVKTLLTPVFLINMVERINVLEGILRKI